LIVVQMIGRTAPRLNQAGRQEMIEMYLDVHDADGFQPQRIDSRRTHRIVTWAHHDRLTCQRIDNERAIALQRTDWKGFTSQQWPVPNA
jgi:hypothetical protein